MTKIILSKRYAECWLCEYLTTIFEYGYKKRKNFGREFLCVDCLKRVQEQGYLNRKLSTSTL